ncbi:NAD(P)-dependent oxidoreductase [Amycolatopsis sp. SID8362]|uniref:NAD(P)-dependent oxidoreductase n=1 Tax=Amycolatopsis sp. SID8362 TaxID=2690346 RepID=UPI00136AB311|nr:NAD(P)-dependent oxidoreductase [Amycolatopsis sp. SID8362]NBH03200.1 hypothetical protein [Amycolatopsis sp. SID8362]NED39901.1 NAD(P)-dependent oxidoreductase [Amycolatopsis sp. SID8362]
MTQATTPTSSHGILLTGAVMTHPRRPGLSRRLLAAAPEGTLRRVADPDPAGPPTALRTAIRAWSAIAEGATHHLVLQDDALPVEGFFDHARAAVAAAPHAGIAFYTNWNSRNGAAVRLAALAGRRWAAATQEYTPTVALALPAEIAAGFAEFAVAHGSTWPDDVVMARYLRAAGVPVLLVAPNLVEHADEPSLLRNDSHGSRRSACFAAPPDGEWSLGSGPLDPDVIPFFKHNLAQCVVRSGGRRTTVEAERYFGRAGLDFDACQKLRLEVTGSASDALADLDQRLGEDAVEGLWTTAYLLGVLDRGHPRDQAGTLALSTIGPGGLCTTVGASTLQELRPALSGLAELGYEAGMRARRSPTRRRERILVTSAHRPLGREIGRHLADRGYQVSTMDGEHPAVDAVIHVAEPGATIPSVAARHVVWVCPPGAPVPAAAPGISVLRTGSPYGPGIEGYSTVESFVRQALLAQPIESDVPAEATHRLAYIRDIALAVHHLLHQPAPQRTVATPVPLTSRELVDAVARAVRPVPVTWPPPAPGPADPPVVADEPATDLDHGIRALAQWLAYEKEEA